MIFKNRKENSLSKKDIFFGGIKSFVIILLTGFLVLTGFTFGGYREASLTEVSLSGISGVSTAPKYALVTLTPVF